MGCSLRQGRDECDGRSATLDDDDAPAGVIKVLWPGLRVDDGSFEAITPAKLRALREPDPYKGKGIKYSDEVIRRKVGKKAGAGAK